MSTDETTPAPTSAPDGSTEVSPEQKEHTEGLSDGSKSGLVDDDRDPSAAEGS
ncbi:hypothetical protein ACPEEZ_14545 [Frigoribacterium sp. 2-23]|uniref:hypothetical protein n=1 Tax=Frigoribacterium sp. 2-23 TaxID=3415006 RepID=UPI003C6ED661